MDDIDLTDLSDTRLKQLEEYAESYFNHFASTGEKMLARRLKVMIQEVRKLRKELSK